MGRNRAISGKRKITKRPTKEFFLETSVHIKKAIGHRLTKENISHVIGNYHCWSSYYIFGEYKCSLISALIDFYFLIEQEESPSEAMLALSEEYSIRKLKFDISGLAHLIKDNEFKDDKTHCIIELERLIENAVDAFLITVNEGKNLIANEMCCPIGKTPLIQDEKLTTKENYELFKQAMACRKDMEKCKIKEFWKKHKGHLKSLTSDGAGDEYKDNKAFCGFKETYDKILKDNINAKGKNCAIMGDTIIALECPENKTLLTYDHSFQALCGILNKEYEILPSLAELKKKLKDQEIETLQKTITHL